jgi:hypothetical protein
MTSAPPQAAATRPMPDSERELSPRFVEYIEPALIALVAAGGLLVLFVILAEAL